MRQTVLIIVFLPLLRYSISDPGGFTYRAFTRLGTLEHPIPGPIWQVFLKNLWNGLVMMNWSNGDIWVVSVTNRPALDVVTGALFVLGVVLLSARYASRKQWQDIFLLVSIPLLLMPSVLSLAYPNENPAPNRASGTMVIVFLIAALALECILRSIVRKLPSERGKWLAAGVGIFLVFWSCVQNYDLVFNQYQTQYSNSSWNTSEMGAVIKSFVSTIGESDRAWVLAYPHWVDNRLVGMNAGSPTKDYSLFPGTYEETLAVKDVKLFLIHPEDSEGLEQLQSLYPHGFLSLYDSVLENKDFYVYLVPAEKE